MRIVLTCLVIVILFAYLGIQLKFQVLQSLYVSFISLCVAFFWSIKNGGLKDLFRYKQTMVFIYFIVIGCFSTLYAVIGTKALTMVQIQVENFILLCICYYVFKNTRGTNFFITFWVALHTFLVIINIGILNNPLGRRGNLKAGYFLGDWNDFSWSLVIVLPFAIYLFSKARGKLKKLASLGSIATIISGIILAQSRGAALAAAASVAFLVFNSRRRVIGLTALVCASMVILVLGPSSYIERLKTIEHYDEDSSAKGRIMAWKASTEMAIDYPLGVGPGNFPNVYGRFYREKYADQTVWAANRWVAAHSIYFLTLAEYGLPGLMLLLMLIYWNFVGNVRLKNGEKFDHGRTHVGLKLPVTINASLLAFATGGIFLGGLIYPHIYILTSMTMGLHALTNQDTDSKKTRQ